jgi:hypothetical protein
VLRDKVDDCDLKILELKVVAAHEGHDPKASEHKLAHLKATIASFERRVADRPTGHGPALRARQGLLHRLDERQGDLGVPAVR